MRFIVLMVLVPMTVGIASPSVHRRADAGLSYTFTITHHGLNADGRAADYEVVGSTQLVGDQVWIQYFEPPQSASNGIPDADRRADPPKHYGYGAYYLFTRGSTVMTVVSPSKKKYFTLDQATALQGFNKTIHVTLNNATITVARIQPDTMIDEVATQHWRLVDDHQEKVSVIGISSSSDVHSTIDYYFAPDLRTDFNPFLRTDDLITLAGPGDYATKMRAALDQMGSGIPVLSIERRTAGKGVPSSLVKRITSVSRGDVPATLFVVPTDFQKSNNDAGIAQEPAWLPDSLTTPLPKKEPGLLSKVLHVP